MSTTDYVISAVLILLVLRQIPERRLSLFNLILPVAVVVAAAAYYLRGIPTGGHDLWLDGVLVLVGVALGAGCALASHMRRDAEGHALARAGWLAALLWVVGMGGRMAFAIAVEHGFGPTVARFSAQNQITGSEAWVAALVLMALAQVLVRVALLRLRGRLLPAPQPARSRAPAGA